MKKMKELLNTIVISTVMGFIFGFGAICLLAVCEFDVTLCYIIYPTILGAIVGIPIGLYFIWEEDHVLQ